jgi:hypothetical protein
MNRDLKRNKTVISVFLYRQIKWQAVLARLTKLYMFRKREESRPWLVNYIGVVVKFNSSRVCLRLPEKWAEYLIINIKKSSPNVLLVNKIVRKS